MLKIYRYVGKTKDSKICVTNRISAHNFSLNRTDIKICTDNNEYIIYATRLVMKSLFNCVICTMKALVMFSEINAKVILKI